jgi:hypothetical protein
MLRAIQAVQVFQDKKWIPKELSTLSYFSVNDLWHYFAVSDERLCEYCDVNDGLDISGDILRGKFPDLEIIDENTIYPHVHVTLGWKTQANDNCRCMLIRVAAPQEFLEELGYKYPKYKGHE